MHASGQSRKATLEVYDDTGRDAGAIRLAAWRVEADIVNLRPEGQMRQEREVHAATETPGKLAVRASAASNRNP